MPTTYPPARTASVARLSAAVFLLATAGVALAAPAAAIEDTRRPTATVTHGPSCGPAVVRTLVTNGTEPHSVTLVFDDTEEQDSAELGPGEQVELVSSDVDWGVTVDVTVVVTAEDGTPEAPLELETYTRPDAEDCAAVTSPTSSPAPPPPSSTAPQATPDVTATPTATEPETTPPTTAAPAPSPTVPTTPVPGTSRPADPATSAPATTTTTTTPEAGGPPRTSEAGTPAGTADRGGAAASSSAAAVSPGGVVTVRATGFTAGEPVTVTIPGIDEPLTTVTAAADGSVETVVQIPRDVGLGSTTVQFTGTDSATTAGLDLDVAARDRVVPESTGSPAAVAAGVALVGAAGTLGVMGARRSRGRHADPGR